MLSDMYFQFEVLFHTVLDSIGSNPDPDSKNKECPRVGKIPVSTGAS